MSTNLDRIEKREMLINSLLVATGYISVFNWVFLVSHLLNTFLYYLTDFGNKTILKTIGQYLFYGSCCALAVYIVFTVIVVNILVNVKVDKRKM